MNKNVKQFDNTALANVSINNLSHDGRGIASIDGKTTFVSGALPDETVSLRYLQKRGTYNEAEVQDILTPSPQRVTPPCAHFGLCGGCSLQHMSMQTQIELKQQTLLDQLKHFGKVEPEQILPPLHAESLGYRRKARLGAKFVIKKNKMLVGFREKKSNYLADLESCVVLHPNIGQRFLELRELIGSLELAQQIPQIEIAIGDTDTALVFRHLADMPASDREQLIAFGKKNNLQIYLQPNPPAPVQKIWPADQQERLTYTLPEFNLEFLFHPLDFTQINLELNRLMVKQALNLLDPQINEQVLDLFCGIGNFTLPIARHAAHVIGIEGSNEMVTRGYANAKHNQIENVEFHAANLMEPSEQASWIKKQYDKILLDPPRAGAKEILPFIPKFNPKRIVYVSCNPATLARDAGELVHQYGFKLTQVGMMNMFPHTAHIEAMAVFEKK